ncbi:hypothetical protein ACLKA7_012938 [Drosophila subpalustris]
MYVYECAVELSELKMTKYALYNISRKYKTYPANLNMECKSQLLEEHENMFGYYLLNLIAFCRINFMGLHLN